MAGSVCIGHHGPHGIAGLRMKETSQSILKVKMDYSLLTSIIKYDIFLTAYL
jgi:hypothetical protein